LRQVVKSDEINLPIARQLIVLAIMAFANESVASSILGGSDHNASKIHGQDAIIYT
jgi:hypothetical protein